MEAALDVVAQTHRLQQEFNDFVEIARDCLLGLLKSDIHRYRNIKLAFDDVTEILHHANLKISNYNDSRRSNFDEKIILVTQYYVPSSMLTHDIDSTLLKNLANPFISDVYLLNEKFYQLEKFPFQSKLHQIVIGRRPTFQDFFQYANVHLQNKLILIGI